MQRTLTGVLSLAALVAGAAAAQTTPPKYLDIYMIRVKPEKNADFMAIGRKIVDANRRNGGDTWTAYRTEYGGDGNTYSMVTPRRSFADIDQGMTLFRKALKESYGAGVARLMQEADMCIQESRGELVMVRPDLSSNIPEDVDTLFGNTRWIRSAEVQVRRGQRDEFEEFIKFLNGKRQGKYANYPIFAMECNSHGTVEYHFTTAQPSLSAFDALPTMKDVLGDDYGRFQKIEKDAVQSVRFVYSRVVPELSNPPEKVVNVSRDFWTARPAAMTAARKTTPKPAPPMEKK